MRNLRISHAIVLALVALLVGACDTDVTNPGPTEDSVLDGGLDAVVQGADLTFAQALWRNVDHGGLVAKEVVLAGSGHPFRFPVTEPFGHLTESTVEDGNWNFAQRARWTAEDAIRRVEGVEGTQSQAGSMLLARAYLLAGYANRLLGENHCEAVIDEGPLEPHTVFFERAEAAFTQAMSFSQAAGESELGMAAQAGRASVRLHMHDDSGAAQDAAAIPDDFEYTQLYSTAQRAHFNEFAYQNTNNPYRSHTAWGTWFEDYYLETGDPRAAWGTDPEYPEGSTAPAEPWYFALKALVEDAPIMLSSGSEMRLIEAELLLRAQDWEGAMDMINANRTSVISDQTGEPLDALVASDSDEAWTHLQNERRVELWLEARRLGDLRRWIEAGFPGELDDMSERSLCLPVPRSERDANPNIS